MGSILHKERNVIATFVLTFVFFVVKIRSLVKTNTNDEWLQSSYTRCCQTFNRCALSQTPITQTKKPSVS